MSLDTRKARSFFPLLVARTAAALTLAVITAAEARAQPRSGFDFMSRDLQAMQRDDSLNPGLLWVIDGLARWAEPAGTAGRSCADCHGGKPAERLRGAATRYPKWDPAQSRPLTLAGQVMQCRTERQGVAPGSRPAEAEAAILLALETAVAHASRGLPATPSTDPRLEPWRERGERLWRQRLGQLDLSCQQCHDDHVGARLGGSIIPPGTASGYPTYRLEWQGVGGLPRRIRNCLTGVRAEPLAAESDDMRALETWLAWRGRGLSVETPAVRP